MALQRIRTHVSNCPAGSIAVIDHLQKHYGSQIIVKLSLPPDAQKIVCYFVTMQMPSYPSTIHMIVLIPFDNSCLDQ